MSEGRPESEEHARRSRELLERVVETARKRQADGTPLPRARDPAFDELPDDDWHAHVYVHFSWLACESCKIEADLQRAREGVAPGEPGMVTFSICAVRCLRDAGWQLVDGSLYCPACSANLFPKISN